MKTEWQSVGHSGANGFPCDFDCERVPVGWVRIRKKNRSLGGIESVEVYMACEQHIGVGEAVYPTYRED